jgi:hypothetical protein
LTYILHSDKIVYNKGGTMKRFIVIIMSIILLMTPLMVNAVEADDMDSAIATINAKRDAEDDVNGALWFGAGCLFGILGVAAVYIVESSPKEIRIMGRSPKYVAVYASEYKKAKRSGQTMFAISGFTTAVSLYTIFYSLYYL